MQAFARDQLTPNARVVAARRARRAGSRRRRCRPRRPPKPRAGAQAGGESINADEPWRSQMPQAGPARDRAAADAGIGDAAERPDA